MDGWMYKSEFIFAAHSPTLPRSSSFSLRFPHHFTMKTTRRQYYGRWRTQFLDLLDDDCLEEGTEMCRFGVAECPACEEYRACCQKAREARKRALDAAIKLVSEVEVVLIGRLSFTLNVRGCFYIPTDGNGHRCAFCASRICHC